MGWEDVNGRMGGIANGEVLAFGGVEVQLPIVEVIKADVFVTVEFVIVVVVVVVEA